MMQEYITWCKDKNVAPFLKIHNWPEYLSYCQQASAGSPQLSAHQYGWMLTYNQDRQFKSLLPVTEMEVMTLFDMCGAPQPSQLDIDGWQKMVDNDKGPAVQRPQSSGKG